MATKSFYNLDDIIELNEKRVEQYTSAYQKVLERFTNIVLIYSAIAVFLIPLLQDLIFFSYRNIWMIISFIVFIILFGISIFHLIRLIIPVKVAYLESPQKYYTQLRHQYEQTITNTNEIDKLLKASYIDELETAIINNEKVFRRKS